MDKRYGSFTLYLIGMVLILGLLTGCRVRRDATIVLADQFGLAYSPIVVARLKGWFQEEAPGMEFRWETTGNAAAVREAILAGRMDGGAMGIPPYLIGVDKGMEWTAISAVAQAELGLATRLQGIANLRDLPEDVRIALPQPGSIQHILLAMAAQRELGRADAFDDRLITLSHPDGLSALLAGSEVDAHFTSPPYLRNELAQDGIDLIIEGRECFGGPFTFIVMVLSEELIASHPEAADSIRRAVDRGARWITQNPTEAAELLTGHYGMGAGELERYFSDGTLTFGGPVVGIDGFRDFMHRRGYLASSLDDCELVRP